MKKSIGLVLVLLLLLAACSAGGSTVNDNPDASPSVNVSEEDKPEVGLNVGDLAPDIELTALDGTKHKLSDYRGKVVFLNLWTTWCPYCEKEMPAMQRLYEEYKDDGFIILAIDIDESAGKVATYMEEHGLTFPAFLYKGSLTSHPFNKTSGTPQTYIIDREGVIRQYAAGYKNWDTLANQIAIKKVLKRKK